MRDKSWLVSRLDNIWNVLFPDIERKNIVVIRFKGRWKNKFGHIKRLKDGSSEVVINGFFADEIIPEYMIDLTIAHELVHYMHGFNSPHPKMFSHPHKGGIVNRELRNRGFGHLLRLEKEFTKRSWPGMYEKLTGKENKKPGFITRMFNV